MDGKDIVNLFMHDIELFNKFVKDINKERSGDSNLLTQRQFFVLLKIYKHKKMELKNLSKELNVSTSSLCILLNKLVDQGYVYRKEDTRDRRNTFYGITEFGEEIINDEMEKISSIIEVKLNKLDVEDRKIMIESLQNIKNIANKFITIND